MSIKISTPNDLATWIKDMHAITPVVCLYGNRLRIYTKRALLDEWHSFKLFCYETYVDKSSDIVNWLGKKADDPEDYATFMSESAGLIIADSNGIGKVLLNYMHDNFLIDKVLAERPDAFWTFLNKKGNRVCGSDSDLRCIVYDRFQEEVIKEVKHRISSLMLDLSKVEPAEFSTAYEENQFKLGIFKMSLGIYACESILEEYFDNHSSEAKQSLRKISVLRQLLLDTSPDLCEREKAAKVLMADQETQEVMSRIAMYQAKINVAWSKMSTDDPVRYEQYLRKSQVYKTIQQLGSSCRTVTVTANLPAYMTEEDYESQTTTMISVPGIKLEADRLREPFTYVNGLYDIKVPDEVYERCFQCRNDLTLENITEIRFRKNVFEIK